MHPRQLELAFREILDDEPARAPAPPASATRRRKGTRPQTVSVARLPQREVDATRAELRAAGELPTLPLTRAECIDGPRPCPFVSCRHHLALDVLPNGSLRMNFPELEPDELEATCALDIAGSHPDGVTLEDVGRVMNLTRERVRQIELVALAKLRANVRT